ncbi:LysR family transcriptional regulator [Streptomyces sp. SL13]|jgi:DNA-binding transcriptional LysR family regulator|uniref:LysR family transcriptional regulator n=1 Tax=Streptantibioticus silvisoli TaxID=2705255 RepID=A0AA90K9G7_9ACTN|nr:LysR family transcriptional regulator [Streptantibioticus silvisoli]MDI5964624.1 LysR family transcriptional regulator [Streptantibioticus silvisoli]MDI5970872.1 LysR family transcriptional regulator [Streptantibioticus silvisoli]
MELDVRHLKALCAIADLGSLHKAARALGMTQPSLSTQLRRIEDTLGGRLFTRERTGCRPTPLGLSVVCRARPLVAEMTALVADSMAAAAGTQLRLGSTSARLAADWLRRLRDRVPGTETGLHVDVSANALLAMVADGRLDVAFVHEVEGCPLRPAGGLERHVLVEREPQFVALSADHPAAARPVVDLADLGDERWMVDPAADGEWDGLRRVLAAAGVTPRVVHGDYLTAASLVGVGEVVTICRPTSRPRPDTVIRPLRGDPLAVSLFTAVRVGTYDSAMTAVHADLRSAYDHATRRTRDAPADRERRPG